MRIFNLSKIFIFFVVLVLAVPATVVLSHTDLVASVPAARSSVKNSPETLELTFGEPVQLMRLTLTGNSGESIPLGFSPGSEAAAHHSYLLPELAEGRYTVRWGAMASDGHQMTGRFNFSVEYQPNDSTAAREGQAR